MVYGYYPEIVTIPKQAERLLRFLSVSDLYGETDFTVVNRENFFDELALWGSGNGRFE
jgi:hypothetical protein